MLRGFDPSLVSTREMIILTAERLFATNGIETVPLREIARASNNKNNTAVRYHFGSREGLIQAIFRYRIPALHAARGKLIREAEASGKTGDLLTLVRAWLLPMVDIVDLEGRHSYAGFMSQYLLRSAPLDMPYATGSSPMEVAGLQKIPVMIAGILTFVPPPLLRQRIQLAYLMFANMLMRHDYPGTGSDELTFAQMIEDSLNCAAGALSAAVGQACSDVTTP